jgi:hypothetical protein
MLNPDDRFRPNSDGVVAEVVDGEAIILNLVDGTYYSLDQVGGRVWTLLEEKRPIEAVLEALVGEYEVSAAQARADLEGLLGELLDERLIVAVDQSAEHLVSQPLPPVTNLLPYVQPHLNTFRQMAELLALDPPMPNLQDLPWPSPGGGPST